MPEAKSESKTIENLKNQNLALVGVFAFIMLVNGLPELIDSLRDPSTTSNEAVVIPPQMAREMRRVYEVTVGDPMAGSLVEAHRDAANDRKQMQDLLGRLVAALERQNEIAQEQTKILRELGLDGRFGG